MCAEWGLRWLPLCAQEVSCGSSTFSGARHALCVRVEYLCSPWTSCQLTWQMPREAVHGRIQGGAKEGRSTSSCPSKILCVLGMAQCDRFNIRTCTGRTGLPVNENVRLVFPSIFYLGIRSWLFKMPAVLEPSLPISLQLSSLYSVSMGSGGGREGGREGGGEGGSV